MPRPIRTTAPVYASDDASQREASTLWGGMTVYTDDRLQPGFIRVGIDDPQYFAIHESGVIPVSREMAYGEVAPDPWWFTTPAEVEPYERRDQARHNDGRGGRVRMEYVDEAAHGHDLDLFAEVLSIDNITDDGQMTIRRGRGTTRTTPETVEPMRTPDDVPMSWWDMPEPATAMIFSGSPVRYEPERAADHRHEWAVTAMHMDGGVRFDLGCAHCDAVHRNVHRDHMERLIDSNTAPDPAPVNPTIRPERIRDTDVVLGGHRLPTERWSEGGYVRTLFRVEGFRQDGELVTSQRTLTYQPERDHAHAQTIRQRIIAELVEDCERLGMLRDDRVRISERTW